MSHLPKTQVYVQHGHDWPRCEAVLECSLAAGVVLSPRDVTPKRQEVLSRKIPTDFRVMIDPQLYALEWAKQQGSRLGRLPEYAHFRSCNEDRLLAGKPDAISETVAAALQLQQERGASSLIGPGLLIRSIKDDVDERHAALWQASCEYVEENVPLHLSVVVDESVLADYEQRSLLIDALIHRKEAFGFYLLPHIANAAMGHSAGMLMGVMDCVLHLRERGFDVLVGCCGCEALLYCAAGANAVAIGMQPNTQQFGEDRWIEAPDIRIPGDRKRPNWALVSHLLRELRLSQIGLLKACDPQYWWQCECHYCDIIRDVGDIETIAPEWSPVRRALHYISVIQDHMQSLNQYSTTRNRVVRLRQVVLSGLQAYTQHGKDIRLDRRTNPMHLIAWRDALDAFSRHAADDHR